MHYGKTSGRQAGARLLLNRSMGSSPRTRMTLAARTMTAGQTASWSSSAGTALGYKACPEAAGAADQLESESPLGSEPNSASEKTVVVGFGLPGLYCSVGARSLSSLPCSPSANQQHASAHPLVGLFSTWNPAHASTHMPMPERQRSRDCCHRAEEAPSSAVLSLQRPLPRLPTRILQAIGSVPIRSCPCPAVSVREIEVDLDSTIYHHEGNLSLPQRRLLWLLRGPCR